MPCGESRDIRSTSDLSFELDMLDIDAKEVSESVLSHKLIFSTALKTRPKTVLFLLDAFFPMLARIQPSSSVFWAPSNEISSTHSTKRPYKLLFGLLESMSVIFLFLEIGRGDSQDRERLKCCLRMFLCAN